MEDSVAATEAKWERRFRHMQKSLEQQNAALEAQLRAALVRLENLSQDMKIVTENADFLRRADDDIQSKLDVLEVDVKDLEMCLTPIFEKFFPNNSRFASAFRDVLYKDRSKRQ